MGPPRLLAGALLLLASGVGCDGFLEVRNPMELEAGEVDPREDAEMFSRSAFQSFVEAFGNLSLHTAWFTHEARVGDSFPTRNEFGLRHVTSTNASHTADNWGTLHRALAGSEAVIRALGDVGGIHLARAQLVSGWAVLLMAESFCEGTIALSETEPGRPMSTGELVEAALRRLAGARAVAGAEPVGEAEGIVLAATTGMARAHLLAGRRDEAAGLAGEVPTGFAFELPHADDPSNRWRLGNRMWQFSDQRPSLVVPPHVRARADAGDARVPYTDAGRAAQDGELRFFRQEKFPGWSAPSLLTSGLEARYIEVEARGDPAEMLEFVNERRAVGGQPPIGAPTERELLLELLRQKALDHWLEGKRMGDLRRHGDDLPWLLDSGGGYYKPRLGSVGTQRCWPVPSVERWTNPNWG